MKSYNIQIGDYVYFTKAINEEEAKEKAIKFHTERRRKLVSNISYVDKYGKENSRLAHVAETEMAYHAKIDYDKLIREKRKEMEKAAKELDFIKAAEIRDEIKALQDLKNK